MSKENNVSLSITNSKKNFIGSKDQQISPMGKYPLDIRNDRYTSLLIQSENDDLDTTFVDNSQYGHTLTIKNEYTGSSQYGHVYHSHDQAKFGNSSLHFPGSYSNEHLETLSHSSLNFGQQDFTIDCWAYYTDLYFSGYMLFKRVVNGTLSTVSYALGTNDHKLLFRVSVAGEQIINLVDSVTMPINQWTHVAGVRHGSDLLLFKNGQIVVQQTLSNDMVFDDGVLVIGYNFSSYLEEIRISKGIARWTENFTPPDRPCIKI